MAVDTTTIGTQGHFGTVSSQIVSIGTLGHFEELVTILPGGFYSIYDLDEKHEIMDLGDKYGIYDLDDQYEIIDPDE